MLGPPCQDLRARIDSEISKKHYNTIVKFLFYCTRRGALDGSLVLSEDFSTPALWLVGVDLTDGQSSHNRVRQAFHMFLI